MPILYCSSDRCGYPITYTTSRPETCPKCLTAIAKTFIPKPIPTPPIATAQDDNEPPLSRRVTARRAAVLPLDNRDNIETNAIADDDDGPLDRRAARQLARELIASIDPSSIHTGTEGEDVVVRFGDLISAAQREGRA